MDSFSCFFSSKLPVGFKRKANYVTGHPAEGELDNYFWHTEYSLV